MTMKRKKIYIWFFIIAIVLLFNGCGYFNLFYNAKKYYNQGNYKKSKEKCKKIIADQDYKHLHDDSYFILGNIHYNMKENNKAYLYYEKIVNNYKDSKYYIKSLTKMIKILINNNNFQKAYSFYNEHITENMEKEKQLKYIYAELLIELNFYKEYKSYLESISQKDSDFPVLWAYYYYKEKNFENLFNIIKQIEPTKKKQKLILALYTKDFNYKLFNRYYKNKQKYAFLEDLLYPEINIKNIEKYYDLINKLSNNLRTKLIQEFLFKAIRTNKYDKAGQLTALFTSIKKQKEMSENTQIEYSVNLQNNFKKYRDLPNKWDYLIHDNRDYYLIEKTSSKWYLYALKNNIWREISMKASPSTYPSNFIPVWDENHKRWLFLEFGTSKIHYLTRDNFKWDTITLEGETIENISKENVFIDNDTIYLFYKLSKIYQIKIKDNNLLSMEEFDIKGSSPDLKEYTFIPNLKNNQFIVVGGRKNEIKNFNAYILNYNQTPLKWQTAYLNSDLNFFENTVKTFNSQNNNLIISWQNNNPDQINNIYTWNYNRKEKIITVQKCMNTPETVDDFFEYQYLFENKNQFHLYYQDPDVSYNNLKLLNIKFNLNSSNITKEIDDETRSSFLIESLSGAISDSYFNDIIYGLEKILQTKNITQKEIGDIYLIYFKMPKEAQNFYKSALRDNPNDIKLLYALGYLHFKHLKNYQKALEYFNDFKEKASESNIYIQDAKKFIDYIKSKK